MRTKKGYYILKNWFNGKWVYHYYPNKSHILERAYNEFYSFYLVSEDA